MKLRFTLTDTHQGFKQAGRGQEPQDPERPRQEARWMEPQQQVGHDTQRSGQNQPVGGRGGGEGQERGGIKERASVTQSFEIKTMISLGRTNNQPRSEFADGRLFAAAHQISNQRVGYCVPGPTHKQDHGNVGRIHLWVKGQTNTSCY